MEVEKFKLADILYGLVIPVLIAILIIAFPAVLRPALDSWFPPGDPITGEGASPNAYLTVIFTHGFSAMVAFGIPLLFGLIWNKWAGGGVGFITGTLYYVAFAGWNIVWTIKNFSTAMGIENTPNLYADPAFIGNYIVGSILIGYIAGALNNKSVSFKRMIGAGLTATLTVGVLQFILNLTVSTGAWMAQGDPSFALFTTMLPMILLGIIVPIIAKVMTWYGLQPMRHQ